VHNPVIPQFFYLQSPIAPIMTITPHKQGKLITLSKPLGTRQKILFLFYFIVFFSMGFYYLLKVLTGVPFGIGFVVGSIIITASLLASYRFANKAMQSEQLFIDNKMLFLIDKGLHTAKRQSFDLDSVSDFRYLSKPELNRHALAGESFDYLGFQTGQQVINEMHGDKRIAFDYHGKTIAFGDDIYSWEYAEIASLLPGPSVESQALL
jgi:hypothetical protein